MKKWSKFFVGLLVVVLAAATTTACNIAPDPTTGPKNKPPAVNPPAEKGQTSFETEDINGSSDPNQRGGYGENQGAPAPSAGANDSSNAKQGAPSGRTGTVEEADLYRVRKNLLFYLNTYKGLTVFDLKNPKKPAKLASLPVFGYPIEMFVEGDIVYALVRDALYLTRVKGKLEFHRYHVSQLVTVDISTPSKPQILQRLDIKGQLREGVSRKIDKTIYVVSYKPRHYWWGWRYNRQEQQKDQATVYSFNITNPRAVRMVQKMDILQGKSSYKRGDNWRENRSFSGVTISATANTLLVGEQWYYYRYDYSNKHASRCSQYENYRYTVLSVVDISDPKGAMKLHTRFQIRGHLSDQFKQTYIYNKKSKKGTYLGIYQRQEWSRSGCQGSRLVKNTLVSIDITDGQNPTVLDDLVFGKPNETVRGSLFDPERQVAYAITVERRDPLYAISFADPSNLKILSAVDHLSGDINVFRFIANKKFLLAIGRDNSNACTGFAPDSPRRSTQIAVSILDVRDLSKVRLVQRKCVAVENAEWSFSQINWNLDQAHKMIGMYSEANLNLVTVPVSYYSKSKNNAWWWYEYKSAIGIMKWDLTKYDDTKDEKQQKVLENVATMIHPKGAVKRTIIFNLPQGSSSRRVVLNLSDTHISLVDLQNLQKPSLLSSFELAPYVRSVYRFGNYLVEQVNQGRYYDHYNEFRVKKLVAGDMSEAPVVTTFKVGKIRTVIRFGKQLVFFRYVEDKAKTAKYKRPYYDYNKTEMLTYDLSDPTHPVQKGSLTLPYPFYTHYYFYCGGFFDMYYRFGYYGHRNSWIITRTGLASTLWYYDRNTRKSTLKLLLIDLSNPGKPGYKEKAIGSNRDYFSLVRLDEDNFYLVNRKKTGTKTRNGRTFNVYRYYAQHWTHKNSGWSAGPHINLPGRLIRAYRDGSSIKFVTHDYGYVRRATKNSNGKVSYTYQQTFRLYLLEQIKAGSTVQAILRDSVLFTSWYLRDILVHKGRLFINATRDWYYLQAHNLEWYDRSDTFMIYDLSKDSFKRVYAEATRTYNIQMMGIRDNKLFLNLPGDGVLVVDVTQADQPKGIHFERTLGWLTNIEFAGNSAFLAAGYFGLYRIDLTKNTIPTL